MSSRYFIPVPELSPKILKRFWSHVNKTPGQGPKGRCWTWTGALDKVGYARMRIDNDLVYVHRIGYMIAKGEIPGGKRILHKCDVYNCVRCVYAGTQRENMRDCRERKRNNKSRGSAHWGAKIDEQQVQEIRRLYGELTAKELAQAYGVTSDLIYLIKNRKIWKHVS